MLECIGVVSLPPMPRLTRQATCTKIAFAEAVVKHLQNNDKRDSLPEALALVWKNVDGTNIRDDAYIVYATVADLQKQDPRERRDFCSREIQAINHPSVCKCCGRESPKNCFEALVVDRRGCDIVVTVCEHANV